MRSLATGSTESGERVKTTEHKPWPTMWLIAALAAGAFLPAAGQEEPRPGLDAPRVRVCVADFAEVGQGELNATEFTVALRMSLGAQTQVQLVDGPAAREAAAATRDELLAMAPGAARALGDQIGVDAVVYGSLVQQVTHLLDEPASLAAPLVQLTVVETLTLEGQVFPGEPLSAQEALGPDGLMAEQTRSLLPAMGRVLSIVESPEEVSVQLFPLGGRVLAADTEYGVFSPVEFTVVGEDPTGRGALLALQDLRGVELTGRVRTAAQASGHAVKASSTDPAGHVSVGQLVAIPPAGPVPSASPLPLLHLHSQPTGAVVFVDGQVSGTTPMAMRLEAGRQAEIGIALRHHFAAEYEITAEAGDARAVFAALREVPPFGSLQVTSNPPGATVTLDGAELGVTPLATEEVAAGRHELLIALDGFLPVRKEVEIQRQKATDVSLELEQDFRPIQLLSTPEGARAYLDGDEIGTTPVTLEAVQTGMHEVRLSLAAHAPVNETIRVVAEEAEQTFRFRLRALAGNINIQTTPPGARVTLDKEEKGETPLALTNLSIGEHHLQINLDGYLPLEKTVTVQDQQTTTVQEDLVKAAGELICISVPGGATITLDGRELGVTPTTLRAVPVGRRKLPLTMEGYEPWEATVPVVHGQMTKVEVALIRSEQAGPRRAP